MVYQVPHFISGKKLQTPKLPSQAIYDPALGKPIGEVHFADKILCDKAVSSAKAAFESWSQTPPVKRARILFNFRTLLEQNQHELAKIVTQEHGKTLGDAKGSVARAIEVVELHCGLLTELQGNFTANVATQYFNPSAYVQVYHPLIFP